MEHAFRRELREHLEATIGGLEHKRPACFGLIITLAWEDDSSIFLPRFCSNSAKIPNFVPLTRSFTAASLWINVPLQALGRSLSSIIGRAGHLRFGFPRVSFSPWRFWLDGLESHSGFGKNWMTEHWRTIVFT